jgi:hypothetical protein
MDHDGETLRRLNPLCQVHLQEYVYDFRLPFVSRWPTIQERKLQVSDHWPHNHCPPL